MNPDTREIPALGGASGSATWGALEIWVGNMPNKWLLE